MTFSVLMSDASIQIISFSVLYMFRLSDTSFFLFIAKRPGVLLETAVEDNALLEIRSSICALENVLFGVVPTFIFSLSSREFRYV